jgi:hypothetical protein
MSQYEADFKALHRQIEKRLGQLKEIYKIESNGIPNAYDILNSPKVNSLLGASVERLAPGNVNADLLWKRFASAYKVVQSPRLQNEEKDFCAVAQDALNKAKAILGDKSKEAAYIQWLLVTLGQVILVNPVNEGKTNKPPENRQLGRDELLKVRRKQEGAQRRNNAEKRQKEFVIQQKRKLVVEKQLQLSKEQSKPGFFSRLGSFLLCVTGAHKGEWFYTHPDSCEMTMMCERCLSVSTDFSHSWQATSRILPHECEFIRTCSRCGEEEITLEHKWQWSYIRNGACMQQSICSHCHRKSAETQEVHDWGIWTTRPSDKVTFRRCKRCRTVETEERELAHS